MQNSKLRPVPRSRRDFLGQLSAGITVGLLTSVGRAPSLLGLQRNADADSLKIVKVEPHLLTGVRGYAPWLFVRVETAEGMLSADCAATEDRSIPSRRRDWASTSLTTSCASTSSMNAEPRKWSSGRSMWRNEPPAESHPFYRVSGLAGLQMTD